MAAPTLSEAPTTPAEAFTIWLLVLWFGTRTGRIATYPTQDECEAVQKAVRLSEDAMLEGRRIIGISPCVRIRAEEARP